MNAKQAGYSLAEMLTVVTIIGILALVTVPAFMNFRNSNKVKTSVRNFTTDIRRVRQFAITNGLESKLSFATGVSGSARSYNFYLGDVANGTPNTWTALTTPSGPAGTSGHTRYLDDIVYFPANSAGTPQTFTDLDGDGTLDIVFFPDGHAQMPAGLPQGATVTLKTDMNNIYQSTFQVDVSPSGSLKVH